MDLLEKIKSAFEQNNPARKNIALRLAYDEIEHLRAAAIGASVGAGWQAISTAPTNERVIIYRVHPDGGCDQTAMAYQSSLDSLWFTMPDERLVDFAPTHWRNLDLPPPAVGAPVGVGADLPKASA